METNPSICYSRNLLIDDVSGKNYFATGLFLTATNILYNKRVLLELLGRSLLIECRKQWQVLNKRSTIPVVNVWKSINLIYQEHKCKKGITQLTLTSQRRQTIAIFLRISWNIISEVVFIFCFLNQLFFQGGWGRWEEEVNYNKAWSCFPGYTVQVTLLICITLPSFGIVKYIILLHEKFLQSDWFRAVVFTSLRTAQVPSDWKSARVIPLFKKGKADEMDNYRPISILPVLSKVLERAVHIQLYKYLQQNKILSPYQCGFRKCHSTEFASLTPVN